MLELESITTLTTKKAKNTLGGGKCSFLNLCSTPVFCSRSYISTKDKLSGPVKGYLREMVDWDMWKGHIEKAS